MCTNLKIKGILLPKEVYCIMFKRIIPVVFSIILIQSSAQAFDSNYSSTERCLINEGYSKEMAQLLRVGNYDNYASVNDERYKKSPKRFWKKFWQKIDPAAFPEEDFIWHDIRFDSGFRDF